MTDTRWWKNGDHPNDAILILTDEDGRPFESEGKVVRRFNHPDYPGHDLDPLCGQWWMGHGWIDDGGDGQIVHPGDTIHEAADGSLMVTRFDPMAQATEETP